MNMAKKQVPLRVKKPPKNDAAEAFVTGEPVKEPPAGEETIRLTVYVPPDLVRTLKVAAIDRRTSASALVREAFQQYLGDLAST